MVFKGQNLMICSSAKEVRPKSWLAIARNSLATKEKTNTYLWTMNRQEEVSNLMLVLHIQSNTYVQRANHRKKQDLLINSAWQVLGSEAVAIRINIKILRTMWVQVKKKKITAVEVWSVGVIQEMAISVFKRTPRHISVILLSHRNNV